MQFDARVMRFDALRTQCLRAGCAAVFRQRNVGVQAVPARGHQRAHRLQVCHVDKRWPRKFGKSDKWDARGLSRQ